MAMEINPPRSKDPEQPRETLPSHVISATIETVDELVPSAEDNFTHPIDIAQLHYFTQEAYGRSLPIVSAYLEAVLGSSSLVAQLEDGSYLEFRLEDVMPEAPASASVEHFVEHEESGAFTQLDHNNMTMDDLVVFVRALDSVRHKVNPTY